MPDRWRAWRAWRAWRWCSRPVAASAGVALVLAVGYLLAAPMGTDLAAQAARAGFFARHGATPVDLSWYGGVNQFGYSLLTAGLSAALGVRVLGAAAAVLAAAAFAHLLSRAAVPRPVLGGVLGAVVTVGNLASGRTTFAAGLALGLLACCAARPAAAIRSSGLRRAGWLTLTGLLAALATRASPVAGLFTGLAGAALLLAAVRRVPASGASRLAAGRRVSPGRRVASSAGHVSFDEGWRGGLVLAVAPALALLPMALLFGDSGRQPFTAESMRITGALAVVVFAVVPARFRAVRVGAVLTVVLLLAAYHVPSPIGSNAMRLPMLYAVPVVGACAVLPVHWLSALLATMVWWQPPIVTSDLGRAGSVESRAGFHQPLVAELSRRAPVGRVEVVPLRDHWEAAYVAARVPLARGWERQVDVARNPLFYDGGLDAERYGGWLRANAVRYVALAVGHPPDRYAREEAALVAGGPPYLREVWRGGDWRLFQVSDAQPLVAAPGRLVASGPASVEFTAASAGDVAIRVRWSRWLAVRGTGACLSPGPDGWTRVRLTRPGRYTLSSSLRPGPRC